MRAAVTIAVVVAMAGSLVAVSSAQSPLVCPPGQSAIGSPYCEPQLSPEQFGATGEGELFAACAPNVVNNFRLPARAAVAAVTCSFTVRVSCPAATPAGSCRGYIAGSLSGTPRAGASRRTRAIRIRIRRTSFRVPAGKKQRVKIRLGRVNTKRLRRVRIARGKLTITTTNVTNVAGRPFRRSTTVRLHFKKRRSRG
jgi:hypothetical protein